MSKTVVAVRVRPPISTEVTAGQCLDVIGTDKIKIRRDHEKEHTLNHVFDAAADNGTVWSKIGQPALDAATAGQHACISVFGETGSGKSYTLLEDGLVSRLIENLSGNQEANLCIVSFHHDMILDLFNNVDNLKVKVDDNTGASAEGSTTVRIPSVQAGKDHVTRCLANRDEFITRTKSGNSLLFTAYIFGVGVAQLTIIECAGCERVYKALATDEEKRESIAKQKTLQAYMKCWLDHAVNNEPKAIAWKDAKVTRFLQTGLSAAMDGKGYAAQIVCVKNAKESLYETMTSVTYAETCVKQEGLKSVSEYKEMISYMEERMELNEKEKAGLLNESRMQEAAAMKIQAEIDAKLKELEERKAGLQTRVALARQQAAQDVERTKKDIERQKLELAKKNQEDLDRLRNLAKNAPAQAEADIRKKTSELEAAHKAKLANVQGDTAKIKAEIKEQKELLEELNKMKEERVREEAAAMKPVKDLEKELFKLNQQLKTAGKSREDGLSEAEVQKMQAIWDARDDLDDIEEEVLKIALECMALENGLEKEIGKPEESSDDSDSDDSDNSDSDSDSDSDSETEEDRAARAAEIHAEMERAKNEQKEKVDRFAYEKEYNYFKEVVKKEQYLTDLIDKVVAYVEYGTNAAILTSSGFARGFVFLTRNRRQIAIIDEVADGSVPNRKVAHRIHSLAECQNLYMGQHSPLFQSFLKKVSGRIDPPRTESPPTAEELTPNNMHRYYYRSMSIQFSDGEYLDVVLDTATDFEAMVVSMHRLTHLMPKWGKKLYIDFCDDVDELKPVERQWCEDSHFTPKQYLAFKEKLLLNDEVLFVTLHDVRVFTQLDMFHAQRLVDLFVSQRWVVRRQLNYFKYQEKLDEFAAKGGMMAA